MEKVVKILADKSYSITRNGPDGQREVAFSSFTNIIDEMKEPFIKDFINKLQDVFSGENYGKQATIKIQVFVDLL